MMHGSSSTGPRAMHGQDLKKFPSWSSVERDDDHDTMSRRPLRAAQSHDAFTLLPSALSGPSRHSTSDFLSNAAMTTLARPMQDSMAMEMDVAGDQHHPPSTSFSLPTPPLTNRSPIRPSSFLAPMRPNALAQTPSSTSILPQTFFSFDTRISISIQGRPITLDLRALEDDPKVITELLRATDAERANWMIAAVYFRRAGNPEAAITITNSLIEVMKAHDVSERDQHPAYILLAGCESDLGKTVRRVDPGNGEAKRHFESSQRWLQKVYGVNVPEVSSRLSSTMTTPAAASRQSKMHDMPPRAPHSLQQRLGVSGSPPSGPRLGGQNQMLEREISCLRDMQKRHIATIEDLRLGKRRLEDDLEDEKSVRRRLERQLSEMESERDSARRMEATALQQARQEVEARRRVQDALAEEQQRRQEAERRAGRPLLEDLARLFNQVAQEDGRVPAADNTPSYGYGSYSQRESGSQSTVYR
ncbi:hypothetical protein BD626DRAFT_476039 [Schizophyllum amplum]|uniref:Uncharacterized protein n=1 Tax=Schizophyllum amplum TaxID=97359 RepID=A0A550CYZ2_9AGAR|nr:hypothetical protein BD626DRAFT_476039 [Auriculariopsis ampla]